MLKDLYENLDSIINTDRVKVVNLIKKIKKLEKSDDDYIKLINKCRNIIKISLKQVNEKINNIPEINYPDLPITHRINEIKELIINNQVVIIAGETGSGKSTQIPKICLDLGRGVKGLIGHTQPRRIAAKSVAVRLSKETQTILGANVGYKIRFGSKCSGDMNIKLMTDGILLSETQYDRLLLQYDTIIIDEAHERSLNIDYLLGYLRNILPKRPDLKVIITSATIDPKRFSEHFSNAAIVEVSGRSYPVDVIYHDCTELYNEGFTQPEIIKDAIDLLDIKGNVPNGNILVFFATEREIHDTVHYLKKIDLKSTEIIPLYARLSNSEQQKIFSPSVKRKVILSTNIAETSLTIPGIYYVIDTGLVRVSRYNYKNKVQRLPIEDISQASANQRAGRCGRIAPGICVRLYSEEDYNLRLNFTEPEIQRTNLASVILRMKTLNLGKIENFPFLDMPGNKYIKDGYRLLYELKAINENKDLLPLGKKLSLFPIDPKLSAMLVKSNSQKCLSEVLVIVSFLSIQDPREIPVQFQEKARELHLKDQHNNSDFLSIYNLWNRYHSQTKDLSISNIRKYCMKNFISFTKMREWIDIHNQLLEVIRELKWIINTPIHNIDDIYTNIHISLATGLLSNIGFNYDMREYLGARSIKFNIFPGSTLFKKRPKWILCAELVETSKLYARTVAKIEPAWLEEISEHLTKKHYSDPYWSMKQENVISLMRISLYGLDIILKRRIIYSNINMQISRELFIKHALVFGECKSKLEFMTHNNRLIEEIEELEDKSRKRDVLIDDDTFYNYYDSVIAKEVYNIITLKKWIAKLTQPQKKLLFFNKVDLMKHSANNITEIQYPNSLSVGDYLLPLSYNFMLGSKDDGLTIDVPLAILPFISEAKMSWLVPGMLTEKIIEVLRLLPKNIRKECVPIPQYVENILLNCTQDDKKQSLEDFILKNLIRTVGRRLDLSIFNSKQLSDYYKINYRILHDYSLIAEGRELSLLRGEVSNIKITQYNNSNYGSTGHIDWDFGDLELSTYEDQHGIKVKLYPSLVDKKNSVDIVAVSSEYEALTSTREGIVRLLILNSPKYKKIILDYLNDNELALLFSNLVQKNGWKDDFLWALYQFNFLPGLDSIPRSRDEFYLLMRNKIDNLVELAYTFKEKLLLILKSAFVLKKLLKRKSIPIDLVELYQSVKIDFDNVFYEDFLLDTPYEYILRMDKYLIALNNRLEKAPRNILMDRKYYSEYEYIKKVLSKKISTLAINESNIKLQRINWLINELWISWYAQEIKTLEPISIKRLNKKISDLG